GQGPAQDVLLERPGDRHRLRRGQRRALSRPGPTAAAGAPAWCSRRCRSGTMADRGRMSVEPRHRDRGRPMRAGPRARRRTALAGLGMAGVAGTAAACSLLPGGADEEPSDDTGARDGDGASDGGDGAAEPTPEPGTTFEDWATADDLSPTEIDIAAADERTGLGPGQVEREDRFGTWFSPGFPEDSPVFTAEPLEMDPAAVEALGGKSEAHDALLSVLVATIVDIADTPLLLEADNTRSGEVAPVLLEALGLGGFDPGISPRCSRRPRSAGRPCPGRACRRSSTSSRRPIPR